MDDSDSRDIQACLAGETDAYGRLVDRYESRIARLMWRFSRDPLQCEELVQDVFVEAYMSLSGFRGEAPFVHWLKRIGTRVGYRFWKRQAKERRSTPLGDLEPAETPEPTGPREAAEALAALLARLKPADRLVLTLQYFEECGIEEIARRMGWTKGMVKMRAHRARKKLREIAGREKAFEDLT